MQFLVTSSARGAFPIALSLLALASVQPSYCQLGRGTLNGIVTDPAGAVVPKVRITAISQDTKFTRTVRSSDAGAYSIPDLAPGLYDISAEADGFNQALLKGVRLFVGQTATLDIRLELGTVTQSVAVGAEAALLQESTSHVGTIIEGKALTDIPLNGRNFLQLNLLSPGVTRSKNGNTFDDVQINPTAQSFNVNGQKADYNLFLLDGSTIKEYQHGSNSFSPGVDSIQEFQTTTSNYSAAFGSEAGAQVNLVTKSGSNDFHGVLFEFLRNDKLDARTFFSQTDGAPPYKRNQFGGTLGGPVFIPKLYQGRNRTFFFVSYEGFREVKNIPLLGTVPTPTQLSGDLSSLATSGRPLIDPLSGTPFPNNIIPESRMPATLQPFLRTGIGKGPWLPAPNITLPGSNYFVDDRRAIDVNQVITRIDQRLNERTFLYGRYAFNATERKNPSLNANYYTTQPDRGQSAAVHLSRSLTPASILEITFGYSRYMQSAVKSTAGQSDITNELLKIRGLPEDPDSWGAPGWSVAGFSNLGQGGAGIRFWKNEIFEWRPSFSITKARHSIKLGADILRHHDNFEQVPDPYGSWSFDGRFSNYSLGDFLLGVPYSLSYKTDAYNPQFRTSAISAYFQDDWKATQNLTLNIGVRYEYVTFPHSANRSISNFYFAPDGSAPVPVVSENYQPVTFRGVQQTLYTGLPFITAPSVGLPNALGRNDGNNVAPRFGFAYRIPHLTNTVVRGGYGIFYQRDTINRFNNQSRNPPFFRSGLKILGPSDLSSFDWFEPAKDFSAIEIEAYANSVDFRLGMLQAWNLTLERTMGGFLFSAAYVGNKAQHLASMVLPNQARPGPGPFTNRKRWPTFGTIWLENYDGNSTYHSGQLKVQRPFSNGFNMLLGYTWSKAIDDTGGTHVGEADRGGVQDSYDLKAEKGLAGQDIRHRFSVSYIYELPFGRGKSFLNRGGWSDAIFGGWQVSGITTLQTGSPFTVVQVFNGANTDGGTNRPDRIGDPNGLSHNRPRGEQVAMFFDTSAFRENRPTNTTTGPFRFGNSGRHIVVGPGTANFDFATFKDFKFSESRRLHFRTEFFNIFNHPILGQPGRTLGTPQFGAITSTAANAREIELALKFYF